MNSDHTTPAAAPADAPTTAPGAAPTSADVARLAGVSRATVSFVLNNTAGGRVSERTRAKVRAAADQLGYVPHAGARSLRAGRTGLVLLVGSAVPIGPLFSGFYRELQEALPRHGYTGVLLGPTPGGWDKAARAWAELRPTAVLCLTPGLTAEGVRVLRRSGTRAVFTLGIPPVPGAHALIMDQREVGAAAAAHLLDRGRRRIGVVMPTDPALALFSAPRLAGVRAAVASAGLGALVEPLPLDYTEPSAAQLADQCRSLGLDAVFGYNDEYAMLTQRALQDAGLDVPRTIALVGADDLLLARLLRPRLSSVRMRLPAGEDLADLVDRVVADPEAPTVTRDLMTVELIPRDSS
ncbi:LacI family transcriptional regulator [Kitasatospora sp. MMS16-BH015]|uniref:LacI family DNA-binding transcriptional regulator n=1 Tax=Kitasatospora sp. MMS16-BH015 TaxID=2018025 RepID=UPI000CA22BFB|nr:LacI family DNA-binding transcriptional regulator [Kitasatospora sp. MMS16-BH015]AUG75517.1 LacI family transcriptional regulator [Kitasatospora sp. MMS16-BH015]